MGKNPKLEPDDPEQSKRFIETAKEAEAQETDEAADRAFKKVVAPPKPKQRSGQP